MTSKPVLSGIWTKSNGDVKERRHRPITDAPKEMCAGDLLLSRAGRWGWSYCVSGVLVIANWSVFPHSNIKQMPLIVVLERP
jgi:hypothetical protein